MKVREIKQATNDVLILELCHLMYLETKTAINTQARIAKELEDRKILSSAEEFMKRLG